jgi:hypothetical protein
VGTALGRSSKGLRVDDEGKSWQNFHKLSNLEHCENTKTRRFLPPIGPPDIDGASSKQPLEQPQLKAALSAEQTSGIGTVNVQFWVQATKSSLYDAQIGTAFGTAFIF